MLGLSAVILRVAWASQVAQVQNLPAKQEIAGWGRSLGERNSNPLQYSCLENPMNKGDWWATAHRVTKSQMWLSDWLSEWASREGMPAAASPRGTSEWEKREYFCDTWNSPQREAELFEDWGERGNEIDQLRLAWPSIQSRNNDSIPEMNLSPETYLIPSFPLPREEKGNT